MKDERIADTFLAIGGLVLALAMACLPDERIQNAATVESMRQELDACFDRYVVLRDPQGYKRCHCSVTEKYNRPCAFITLDGGAHD